MANASESDYAAPAALSFVQYAEIKANTGGVYFGLISGFVPASRTKREKKQNKSRAELREARGGQLNPPGEGKTSAAATFQKKKVCSDEDRGTQRPHWCKRKMKDKRLGEEPLASLASVQFTKTSKLSHSSLEGRTTASWCDVPYLWAEPWAAWLRTHPRTGGRRTRARATEASFLCWDATQKTSCVCMLSIRRAGTPGAAVPDRRTAELETEQKETLERRGHAEQEAGRKDLIRDQPEASTGPPEVSPQMNPCLHSGD